MFYQKGKKLQKLFVSYSVAFRVEQEKKTSGYSGYYDAAILLLRDELHFDDLIQPLCLPLEPGKVDKTYI